MKVLLCACLVQRKKLYDRLALVLTDLGNVESQEHLWMLRQLLLLAALTALLLLLAALTALLLLLAALTALLLLLAALLLADKCYLFHDQFGIISLKFGRDGD